MNPYILLGAGVLAVSLAVGGFTFGVKYQRGQEARAELLIAKVRDEAQLGAAAAIASQKKETTIIKQQLETQIREVEVYRECRNSNDVMRMLNAIIEGRAAEPLGGGQLSGVDTPDR